MTRSDPIVSRIVSTLATMRRLMSKQRGSCSRCGGAKGLGAIWVVFKDEALPERCEECEAYLTPHDRTPVDLVYWLRDRSCP